MTSPLERKALEDIFKTAARQARLPNLFEQAEQWAKAILDQAKKIRMIDGYNKQKTKEDPVAPLSLFYIRGVESDWRYQHTKKGGVRTAEKAQTDYHMNVKLQKDGTVTIQFTTSQYAWAAKKIPGFTRGTAELVVRDAKDLRFDSGDSKKFTQTVAAFMSHHSEILQNKVERSKSSIAHKQAFDPK